MKFFGVEVVSIDLATGKQSSASSIFFNEKAANAFMVEEMKWESTVSVKCPALGTEVEGDFVNVSHSFKKAAAA